MNTKVIRYIGNEERKPIEIDSYRHFMNMFPNLYRMAWFYDEDNLEKGITRILITFTSLKE